MAEAKNNVGLRVQQEAIFKWARWSEKKLMQMRLCDLGLSIKGTELEGCIDEFYRELDAKGLSFHPQCYLSDEWSVPDGEPIIGIPFFLAHPRLKHLEQKLCLDVEGGTKRAFMRLIRHEAGHAFNYAYLLHRRKHWKKLFGPFSKEYSDAYNYRPYSKSYVRHLDDWYAQCHPDEDFAETFAVWLTPNRDWAKEYKGWKALEKLRYVDGLMKEIGSRSPKVKKGQKYCDATRMKTRLKTYYEKKKREHWEDYPDFHDFDLKRIFTLGTSGSSAPRFLRRYRKDITAEVAAWTGGKKFVINDLLGDLIERASDLKLRLNFSEAQTLLKVTAYLTSLMMNYLITGSFKKS